jgi:cell division septation protein DedD
MTRMSADDRIDDTEHDLYDEAPPRSIFATMWFRAVLVLIVLAVVVAVAVPYILDATNPPTKPTIASRPQPGPAPPPPAAVTPPPAPAPPSSSALSTQADKAPDAAVADKPVPSARASAGEKPVPAPTEKSTPTENPKMVAAASEVKPASKRVAARSTVATSPPRPATSSEWWVQVGAYREESTARKVAARLREQNYTVEESVRGSETPIKAPAAAEKPAAPASASTPAGVDQYDVFVSGTTTEDLSSRLAGKGLTAEASGGGVVVKPSLPLRDAVSLSKDLATDGLKVQVRRAGSPTGETTIPAADKRRIPAASSHDPLYRVRVGSFSDRTTAVATLKELEGKGYKPFIARGGS